MEHIETAIQVIRDSSRKFGPYLVLEALMPGGTLLALGLYLYRTRKSR